MEIPFRKPISTVTSAKWTEPNSLRKRWMLYLRISIKRIVSYFQTNSNHFRNCSRSVTMNLRNEPLYDMVCVEKCDTRSEWRWKICEFQHGKRISVWGINVIGWRGLLGLLSTYIFVYCRLWSNWNIKETKILFYSLLSRTRTIECRELGFKQLWTCSVQDFEEMYMNSLWTVCVCVFLCFVDPILGNLTVRGHSLRQGTWGCLILTLHLNYVADYTSPLLFLFERTHNYSVDNQGCVLAFPSCR